MKVQQIEARFNDLPSNQQEASDTLDAVRWLIELGENQ
jgi:hypothetical protein